MKETIQTTAYIAAILLFVISLFIFPRYLVKEGRIVEYRVSTNTNETVGVYPVINVVIENGVDQSIYLPRHSFEQAIQMRDSLNLSLRKN